MKKMLFTAAAVGMIVCLGGCAGTASLPVAAARADITLEGTYFELSSKGQAAVAAGVLDKATFKAADAKAYAAVLDARAAYAAGTAPNYASALAAANSAVAAFAALIKG